MTITIEIPNHDTLNLDVLLLDINGTIAVDGIIDMDVTRRVTKLKSSLDIYVVTADTFGTASKMTKMMGIECHVLPRVQPEAEEKLEFIKSLGPERVAAMGNGNNDVLMLKEAGLGIGVLGREGISVECLQAADIIVQDPKDGLDLLLKPMRLIATLRC
jgi:P-type E1-E2 ATPase